MKSETLNGIKLFRIVLTCSFLFFVIYNTYFGWNKLPLSDAEIICDGISKFSFGLSFGILLNTLVKFMELVTNYIINNTKPKI